METVLGGVSQSPNCLARVLDRTLPGQSRALRNFRNHWEHDPPSLPRDKDEFVTVRKDRNGIILYRSQIALTCFIGYLMSRNNSRFRALEVDCLSFSHIQSACICSVTTGKSNCPSPTGGSSLPASDGQTGLELTSILLTGDKDHL